ncbi:hypothetical protein NQZ68_038737 [Dissostichus eleginoides]|nr:hypothetical protein NQZ68_038737 [Dissostichus eleginoides]
MDAESPVMPPLFQELLEVERLDAEGNANYTSPTRMKWIMWMTTPLFKFISPDPPEFNGLQPRTMKGKRLSERKREQTMLSRPKKAGETLEKNAGLIPNPAITCPNQTEDRRCLAVGGHYEGQETFSVDIFTEL